MTPEDIQALILEVYGLEDVSKDDMLKSVFRELSYMNKWIGPRCNNTKISYFLGSLLFKAKIIKYLELDSAENFRSYPQGLTR